MIENTKPTEHLGSIKQKRLGRFISQLTEGMVTDPRNPDNAAKVRREGDELNLTLWRETGRDEQVRTTVAIHHVGSPAMTIDAQEVGFDDLGRTRTDENGFMSDIPLQENTLSVHAVYQALHDAHSWQQATHKQR